MSVGLGNVWRFPFTAYENGGGAFLIPYILVLLFIGKPLYYMELCIGQFSSFGSVKVWEMSPAFRGIGYGQAVATWSVVTYYVSLMAITVYYFFASFQRNLPWSVCGDWANHTDCVEPTGNSTSNTSISSAQAYFVHEVLKEDELGLASGIGLPEWRLALCLLLSWIILFLVLAKGVQGSGKAAYFTALFPYLVLFILLIRGLTLEGAWDGVWFFINPQWEKLLEAKVWYAAVGQSFFSLSVGFGSITMFSSYNNFRHNVYRDAAIISVTDTFTSVLAGVTIFAILGHLAHNLGTDVENVISSGGTSLAFVSYPDVLARFTFAPQFFAVMFFLMLFTLGVGSASALTGCIVTIICDDFPHFKRWVVTLVVCVLGFLLGLFYITPQGQFILTLVDHYGGTIIIFILAVAEVIAVQWVYGVNNFCRDIEFMLNRKTGYYWKFCWAVFIPVILTIIFFYKMLSGDALSHAGVVFSTGSNAFGVIIVTIACALLPLFFGYTVMKRRSKAANLLEAVKQSFKPTEHWCPKDPVIMREYKALLESTRPPPIEGIENPFGPMDHNPDDNTKTENKV
ncbi:unnamed protein product [Meganyctiphanes norvegica]|uniref:Transporter n=1 Tax=Meganyctiphanes norvegica TaxID=48144 RepID=A0AAV2QTZ4_MEGNR